MHISALSTVGLFLTTVHAALKTSIWIDQLPAYSALAPCAENRVSAVVRAQASGCGDDQQLTSFSCFCIDQSSHMSSILSTAVQDYCAASATTLPASLTTPLPEVTAALDVFNSYCARSTELIWYQQNSTAQATPLITAAPTSPPATTTSPSSTTPSPQTSTPSKSVPVAAIAAPVVIGALALLGVVCFLFYLRRRKALARTGAQNPYAPPTYAPRSELGHAELHEVQSSAHEVQSPAHEVRGESVKYRYELETRPAELEGAEKK